MENLPYLERVKIQSEILLPLFKRLREEIGAERANELLRAAVTEYATALGEKIGQTGDGSSLDKLKSVIPIFAANDALEVEPIENSDHELSLNVQRCQFAEHFQSIDEVEFGAMLTCEIDPPMTTGIGEDLSLHRTKTIMSGDKQCDFRWQQRKD